MTDPAVASTVVVVSYRPGDWLRRCLDSVIPHAGEVIVVDNCSADALATTIARQAGARPLRTRRNLGFAGGVAAALPEARGQIVGVLNDDAVADPAWLPSAAAVLEDPGVAAVTPRVVLAGRYREVVLADEEWFAPPDQRPLGRQLCSVRVAGAEVLSRCVGAGLHDFETGSDGATWRWTRPGRPFYVPVPDETCPVDIDGTDPGPGITVSVLNHAGSFLRRHGIAGEHGFGAPDDGRFDPPREPFGFSGTAPVFRAETLRRIGGFAPPFFAYNEDTDWCLRARLVGMRIAYDPAAKVTHRLSATSGGTAAERVRRLSQRNALLCLARNGPAGLARQEITDRLRKGWGDPVVPELVRRLPWALATRRRMGRRWVTDPETIWEQWVEVGSSWDTSPARRPTI
ncbi:MAG: glycosyltransferase family 2 protein [Actinomycetota bacterium]|nr:glycosyltransferase family 2 protein [Actinomycetota bacterium]